MLSSGGFDWELSLSHLTPSETGAHRTSTRLPCWYGKERKTDFHSVSWVPTCKFDSHFSDQRGSHNHFCFQVNKECQNTEESEDAQEGESWGFAGLASGSSMGAGVQENSWARREKGLGRCICSFVPALRKSEQPICVYIILLGRVEHTNVCWSVIYTSRQMKSQQNTTRWRGHFDKPSIAFLRFY